VAGNPGGARVTNSGPHPGGLIENAIKVQWRGIGPLKIQCGSNGVRAKLSVSFRSIFLSLAASKVRLGRLNRAGYFKPVGFATQEMRASCSPASLFG
jgi:hypothetical protein